MINPYRETQERKQEQKTAWREKNRRKSRSEPMLKRPLMRSTKDTMEAVREFNEAGQREI